MFSQDRVNFHQKPEGDTAGQDDPNWPNKTGYSTTCAVMLGSGWGELARSEDSRSSGERRTSGSDSCSVHFAVLFCIFSLSVLL